MTFDYEAIRRRFAETPGRSRAARVRAVAHAVPCSPPTVLRAIGRVDERRGGGKTTQAVHVGKGGATHALVLERDHRAVLEGREGKLRRPEKPAPTSADKVKARADRVVLAIARWESKERRAKNALRKLRARKARYDRLAA